MRLPAPRAASDAAGRRQRARPLRHPAPPGLASAAGARLGQRGVRHEATCGPLGRRQLRAPETKTRLGVTGKGPFVDHVQPRRQSSIQGASNSARNRRRETYWAASAVGQARRQSCSATADSAECSEVVATSMSTVEPCGNTSCSCAGRGSRRAPEAGGPSTAAPSARCRPRHRLPARGRREGRRARPVAHGARQGTRPAAALSAGNRDSAGSPSITTANRPQSWIRTMSRNVRRRPIVKIATHRQVVACRQESDCAGPGRGIRWPAK